MYCQGRLVIRDNLELVSACARDPRVSRLFLKPQSTTVANKGSSRRCSYAAWSKWKQLTPQTASVLRGQDVVECPVLLCYGSINSREFSRSRGRGRSIFGCRSRFAVIEESRSRRTAVGCCDSRLMLPLQVPQVQSAVVGKQFLCRDAASSDPRLR